MDPIEKAIRNAFEKGSSDDRAFRERVYRSAFAALDRALQANPGVTVETAIARRRSLQAKIAEIETEYVPAVRAAAPPQQPAAAPPPRNGPGAAPFVEPPVSRAADNGPPAETKHAPPVAPETAAAPAAAAPPAIDVGAERSPSLAHSPAIDEVAPDRNDLRVRERRRPYGALFFAVTLFSAAAIGGWWAYQTGLIGFPDENGAVPNPPRIVEEEDFVPGQEGVPPPVTGEAEVPRNWVTVFTPDDPSLASAPPGATAEVQEDESGSFLRIRTGSGGAAVIFDVGQGVLEQIAGKKAVFDIIARAEEGKETQISVNCDFGALGDCGRRRYELGYARGEYLFELQLPAKSPGAAGSIAIDSDFSNEGKAVDIYEIRVSVTE